MTDTTSKPEAFFLTCLPLEIRIMIYELYMEDYIQTSTTAVKGLSYLNYFCFDEEVPGDLVLMYEPRSQDTPPLARVCKSIFHEFKPSAGRDVRFVVEGGIWDDDLWANTEDITLPVRCQNMSAIRHLHLELHLERSLKQALGGLRPAT